MIKGVTIKILHWPTSNEESHLQENSVDNLEDVMLFPYSYTTFIPRDHNNFEILFQ